MSLMPMGNNTQQYGPMGPTWWGNNPVGGNIPPENPYPQPAPPQEQKPFDREAFKNAWMGSGVTNVPGMQKWIQDNGYGNQVGVGGSKGDKMYLPNGDVMDGVFGAGAGGNISGPQWTGSGNWMQGGQQQQPGIGPSMQQNSWMQPQQQNPAMQRNQQNKMWQNQQQQKRGIGPQRSPYAGQQQSQMHQWKPNQQSQGGMSYTMGDGGNSRIGKSNQYW